MLFKREKSDSAAERLAKRKTELADKQAELQKLQGLTPVYLDAGETDKLRSNKAEVARLWDEINDLEALIPHLEGQVELESQKKREAEAAQRAAELERLRKLQLTKAKILDTKMADMATAFSELEAATLEVTKLDPLHGNTQTKVRFYLRGALWFHIPGLAKMLNVQPLQSNRTNKTRSLSEAMDSAAKQPMEEAS